MHLLTSERDRPTAALRYTPVRGARVCVFPRFGLCWLLPVGVLFGVRGSIGSDGSQFTHLRCGPLRVGVVSCPWSARRVAVTRRYQHVYELLYALSLTVSMHNGVETGVDSRPGLFLSFTFHVSRGLTHSLSSRVEARCGMHEPGVSLLALYAPDLFVFITQTPTVRLTSLSVSRVWSRPTTIDRFSTVKSGPKRKEKARRLDST